MGIFTALTIAGSDSSGGAGIQADLKTFSALGVYGASVVTAVTAQNTCAVVGVESISPAFVAAQINAVLSDIEVHAVKIGMLEVPEVVEAVARELTGCNAPIVLDPVMVAKSGDVLLHDDAIAVLVQRLLPRANLLTPNLPEAARLLGVGLARTSAAVVAQGRALIDLGVRAVLMKGGHATGELCTDFLITPEGVITLSAPRIDTRNTHGTGCSLSSAVAAGLARGLPLEDAVRRAHDWLQGAIRAADELDIGHGHGPVHHFHESWT